MITQGSNRPLVIGLPLSVTDAEEIHVGLYGSTGQIKHWQNDDTHSQVEISDDGMALICAMTQADTVAFPAGRAHCAVKWLDSDGIIHQLKELPISIKRYSDSHVLGDDEAVTASDLEYTGELEDAQGILNPESIRTAIVIKAGQATDAQVAAWMAAHAAQVKGKDGNDAKINGVNTLSMVAGENVTLTQTGSTLTISAEGGGLESVSWSDVTGKPTSFTPAAHNHTQSDVTGLSDALAGKAASNHTHTIANVSGLQTALDGKQAAGSYAASNHSHAWSTITDKPASYTPASHTHADADVPGLADIKQDIAALEAGKLSAPEYGLAVGKYFRVSAIDENGHAVLEACDLPKDVQINGTSIVNDGVANIPKANQTTFGAIKAIHWDSNYTGIMINSDGIIQTSQNQNSYIDGRTQPRMPITNGCLVHAVDSVLCSTTASEALTATQQASARARLGIGGGKFELIDEITLESDQTLNVSAEPNGTPYNFSAVFIDAEALENFTAWKEWMFLSSTNSISSVYRIGRNYSVSNNKRAEIICNNFCGVWRTEFFSVDSEGKSSLAHYNCFELEDDYKDAVRRIYMDGLKAGTTIKIYAIRA